MDVVLAKKKSLLRSTSIVVVMTMLSRITGFIRDMVIAHLFGASAGVDAFLVAFRIPNLLRRLFAEGAFSQAFVPLLAEYNTTRPDQVRDFLNKIAGFLSFVLTIVTVLAIFFTPVIIWFFAPGYEKGTERYILATDMLRITFPYLLFISLTAMAGATLNTFRYFAIPAFTPVLLNVCLLLAAVYGVSYFSEPVMALAWGVFVAGIVQFLFQIPFLIRTNLLPIPRFVWGDAAVNRVLKLMAPAVVGVSVSQINIMVDTIFASFLAIGSISWLYFSERLMGFPLGVFGVAISTVILPHLSQKHAADSPKEFLATLVWATEMVLLIAIPSTIGLIVLSGPLFFTLFQYGEFTQTDAMMASRSLMAFSAGLPAFMMVKILASGFYAKQDIKTPVRIAIISMILNIVFLLILIKPLLHVGLALSTSLASYANMFLLYRGLKQKLGNVKTISRAFFKQSLFSNVAMGIFLFYFLSPMADWETWSVADRAIHLGGLISVSGLIYFAMLYLTGFDFKRLRGHYISESNTD